jgi:hypothetical protein
MINKNNNECETKLCYESAIRTRFYNGMLLTDQHLREEQQYHREKLKRANRHLLGAGIVCGLKVKPPNVGLCVKIEPGVALDCCGNLIEVCNCINVDLSKLCREKFGHGCIEPDTNEDRIIKKTLVLKYVETESDPEPVLTPAADCRSASEESKCQKSKVREGFCIELWDDDQCPCMETKRDGQPAGNGPDMPNPPGGAANPQAMQSMPAPDLIKSKSWEDLLEAYLDKFPMPCSPCGCCENAIGLASLTIDCTQNTVTVENTCRTYVITPRLIRWIVSTKGLAVGSLLGSPPPGEHGPARGEGKALPPPEAADTKTATKKPAAASKKGATAASEKSPAEAAAQPPAAEEPKK